MCPSAPTPSRAPADAAKEHMHLAIRSPHAVRVARDGVVTAGRGARPWGWWRPQQLPAVVVDAVGSKHTLRHSNKVDGG